MSVQQSGPPPNRNKRSRADWSGPREITEKAMANRGEWFSCDIPEEVALDSVHSRIRTALFAALDGIEVATRDGVLYLKIEEAL